jgi:hypothetical protein
MPRRCAASVWDFKDEPINENLIVGCGRLSTEISSAADTGVIEVNDELVFSIVKLLICKIVFS